MAELRHDVARISISKRGDAALPFWQAKLGELRDLMLNDDPGRFLLWEIVRQTMFISGGSYVRKELRALQANSQWQSRWRPALGEDTVGCPEPYLSYPKSSANLIHHSYHCLTLEQASGRPVHSYATIVELGGGYGSLCRLLFRLGFGGTYFIYDLPEFGLLQRYFLKGVGIPVTDANIASRTRGVMLLSGADQLVKLTDEIKKSNGRSLFIATWSLSESPQAVRDLAAKAIFSCDDALIAYQERFDGVDNRLFFNTLCERDHGKEWKNIPIDHLPGNNYLIGTARAG